MRVLLLNPPFKEKFSRASRSPAVTRGGTIYYPIWLAYCAGVLDAAGFEIKIIDAPAQSLDLKKTIEEIIKFNPRLVIIDTSTPSIASDVKTGEEIKGSLPDSFLVLVGTHPSALPQESLKLSRKIDAVAKGEYDYTIRDLARCIKGGGDLKTVRGLIFRDEDGKININEPRPLIENPDELPFVSEVYKNHLNIKNYFFAASDYPFVMIMTGRGCAFRCTFCLYPQTFHSRQYRPRTPQNVVAEFEYILKNLPEVKEVGIEDDTFTVDRERVKTICRLLIEKSIKIKWYCNVRADLDLETMQWMKKAGCHLLTSGPESGNQQILNNIHKGISVEQIKHFAKNAKKAGLLVHAAFMAGNPGETKETMEETLSLAKELNFDSAQFYPLIVYPGTEAYQWAVQNNYLKTFDYQNWLDENGMYASLLDQPQLSRQDMIEFCNRATKEYYLRPAYILMKLKQIIFRPREIVRTLKAAKTFFKYL